MSAEWAIGLMTGTVLDGHIDVALLRTDGEQPGERGHFALHDYEPQVVVRLQEALQAARDWQFQGPEPEVFATTEQLLTEQQAQAVQTVLRQAGLIPADIAVVGFHGQTVLHQAPAEGQPGRTRQLGDGALMARLLGVPVAFDFRSADVRAGGQGAPLSAIYHAALLRGLGRGADTAVLNLGGVANLTWCGSDSTDALVAFDTGPANAPLNDFISARGFGSMDRDGALAARGRVDAARLDELLAHPWLAAPYPKSLDRFSFTATMAEGCSVEDGAALLTAFSAAAVGRALELLPHRPTELIACGGGRRNPTLMRALSEYAQVEVTLAEQVGWRGDAIEAECFAYLAMRVACGLPISFPGTTGVPHPMQGGQLAYPGD